MRDFLTGPGLWIAGLVCLGGLALRFVIFLVACRRRDRVFYNHLDAGWGLRSIGHWLVPWASVSMRRQPFFSFVGFTFHVTLLAIPLFFGAHNLLIRRAFGFSLPSMADGVADYLTLVFVLAVVILLGRRLMKPEVRLLTGARDWALAFFTVLPFVTGFLAFHQIGDYESMLLAHVLSAEVLLILIPTTRLSHGLMFLLTRAFIGFELGARRGARSW